MTPDCVGQIALESSFLLFEICSVRVLFFPMRDFDRFFFSLFIVQAVDPLPSPWLQNRLLPPKAFSPLGYLFLIRLPLFLLTLVGESLRPSFGPC